MYYLRYSLLCLVLSFFISPAYAALSVDELAKLYAHQQNYHESLKKGQASTSLESHPFVQAVKPIYDEAAITEIKIPANYQTLCNLETPTILMRPQEPNGHLLVHTHGGPEVEFKKDTYHAEIAYYLSHGYTVICPNYRGSLNNPYPLKYMPDECISDVYAASLYIKNTLPDIKSVFLRGGSYGSNINANLLSEVKQGKYKNIFCGAHIVGGLNFPNPDEFPNDIPVFFAHGGADKICHVGNFTRFALQLLYAGHENIETCLATYGDHHMCLPTYHGLKDEQVAVAQEETRAYLEASTQFTKQATLGNEVEITDVDSQIKKLEAFAQGKKKDVQLALQQYEARVVMRRKMLEIFLHFGPLFSVIPHCLAPVTHFVGPSMAHFKLVMGNDFTGDVRSTVEGFIKSYFNPKSQAVSSNLPLDPSTILKDGRFMDQLTQMVYAEEEYLTNQPNYVVMYHAAPGHAMRLYVYLNAWLALLRGEGVDKINAMRFFDAQVGSYQNIEKFLKAMQEAFEKHKKTDPDFVTFNYVGGFGERAIAAVPFLGASRYNASSCSLSWFYDGNRVFGSNEDEVCKKVIASFFHALGIYSKARVERVSELFKADQRQSSIITSQQNVMQQIFVPMGHIDTSAYLCQMWGIPFAASKDDISKPSQLADFSKDPAAFEAKLVENDRAFTNPDYHPSFSDAIRARASKRSSHVENLFSDAEGGDSADNYKYCDALQMRAILYPGQERIVNSYFRHQDRAEKFVQQMTSQILWDFGDFLLTGHKIPACLMLNCNGFAENLRDRLGLGQASTFSDFAMVEYDDAQQADQCKGNNSIFAGANAENSPELDAAVKDMVAHKPVEFLACKMARVCAGPFEKDYFDTEKFIEGYAGSKEAMEAVEKFEGEPVRDYCNDPESATSETVYIENRSYIDVLTEAASATLAPEDYAFFMTIVYKFHERGSAANYKMLPPAYDKFRGLEGLVKRYTFPEGITMTERAKETTGTDQHLQDFTLDYAITIVHREAYRAKENFRKN